MNRLAHSRAAFGSAPLALIVCILAFAGCVAPKVVEYKPFHNKTFKARKIPAELQTKSASELLAGGYLLIGYMDLRHNLETCYDDGICVKHSSGPPNRSDLLTEASRRGGDVVTVLDERPIRERTSRTECTGTYTYTTTVDGKVQVHTNCLGYRTTLGTLDANVSRALVWRYEPDEAASDANANAIEQALLTLETVADNGDATPSAAASKNRNRAARPPAIDSDRTPARETETKEELEARLFAAIRHNDRETLKSLTREGKLKTWSDEEGRSALMFALAVEQLESARTLAALDPELGRTDKAGKSALVYAAMFGDRTLFEQLCKAGHDVKTKGPENAPLLFFAISNPDTAIFDYLLGLGADVRERDAQNHTALMVAAEFGRVGLITRLLKQGFVVEQRNAEGLTALMSAARGEQLEATQLLLNSGANPRALDNEKRTVLHYAAHGGGAEISRLLLEKGAALNAEDAFGRTPLIEAIASEQWPVAELLMNKGAALTTQKISWSMIGVNLLEKNQTKLLGRYVAASPQLKRELVEDAEWLHYAAKRAGADSVYFLLDLGAKINAPTKASASPLMTAASANNAETVRALVQRKANTALRDGKGRTALQVATQERLDKVVAVMRELGVKE